LRWAASPKRPWSAGFSPDRRIVGRSRANRVSKTTDWSDSIEFACVRGFPRPRHSVGNFFLRDYTKNEPLSFAEDPLGSLWLCLFLILASASFLTLAWISHTTGLELWRLKNRGRMLASVSMILFLLPGIVYLLIPGIRWTILGVAVCTFSVFFFAYLQVPSIRRRFDSPSAKLPG
jgi:hypothetical protein